MYGKETSITTNKIIRNSKNYHLRLLDSVYNQIPAFTDVFDEETWYVFVICFVTGTFLVAFILSKYITIIPAK
ncbi:hypothetical protein ALC56_03250 [Trachymyrmex septentrionalis]|uniref:Uncharacterized protein n=1 Tax=Trachymyrmex septentrionalis TaxID=34720 RepID=A0A195FP70_9HYME|nr:PREDICTED: uncharacterized protein LOC108746121 [Trachymyrmex septentrionalis]KYN42112.1 hypothetical protein ALC56_03250 [Trachymyrmex septentrionalis]